MSRLCLIADRRSPLHDPVKSIAVILGCFSLLMLGSCASWRQWFAGKTPTEPAANASTPAAVAAPAVDSPATESPAMPDDGFRLPDMLAMPTEAEFKATIAAPAPPGSGTITVRPPAAAAVESSPAETTRPDSPPPPADR
jgi:hypothetical protein